MKTVTIPFDLELAKKIQNKEVEVHLYLFRDQQYWIS